MIRSYLCVIRGQSFNRMGGSDLIFKKIFCFQIFKKKIFCLASVKKHITVLMTMANYSSVTLYALYSFNTSQDKVKDVFEKKNFDSKNQEKKFLFWVH